MVAERSPGRPREVGVLSAPLRPHSRPETLTASQLRAKKEGNARCPEAEGGFGAGSDGVRDLPHKLRGTRTRPPTWNPCQIGGGPVSC